MREWFFGCVAGVRVQLISSRGDLFVNCQKPNNDNIENSWHSSSVGWNDGKRVIYQVKSECVPAIEHFPTGEPGLLSSFERRGFTIADN